MPNSETVLFVSSGPDLSNPASGEGTRLRNLSRELSSRGWRVLTFVPAETSGQCPEWVTRQYSYEQWSLPFLTDLNPSFFYSLRRVLSRESVEVAHLSTGVCAAKLIGMLGSDLTVVYAAQNVEADHAKDFVDPDLPAYKRLLGPRLIPLIEWVTVRCADGITTVSEKDRDRFVECYGLDGDSVRAVPTGTTAVDRSELDDPSEVRDRFGLGDGPVVVFHGYYEHPPNREAAKIIDEQIAPQLEERGLDAEFLLVGRNPPTVSFQNVHAIGFVEDLYSVLNVADVAAVPILHGGGTKTKLYDYVSLALPTVATEKAIEGVDLEPERHVLLSNGVDEEFVSNLAAVLRDEQANAEIERNLPRLAEEWDWTRSGEKLEEIYDVLMDRTTESTILSSGSE